MMVNAHNQVHRKLRVADDCSVGRPLLTQGRIVGTSEVWRRLSRDGGPAVFALFDIRYRAQTLVNCGPASNHPSSRHGVLCEVAYRLDRKQPISQNDSLVRRQRRLLSSSNGRTSLTSRKAESENPGSSPGDCFYKQADGLAHAIPKQLTTKRGNGERATSTVSPDSSVKSGESASKRGSSSVVFETASLSGDRSPQHCDSERAYSGIGDREERLPCTWSGCKGNTTGSQPGSEFDSPPTTFKDTRLGLQRCQGMEFWSIRATPEHYGRCGLLVSSVNNLRARGKQPAITRSGPKGQRGRRLCRLGRLSFFLHTTEPQARQPKCRYPGQ